MTDLPYVVVAGNSGVGKSSLLAELERRAGSDLAVVDETRFEPGSLGDMFRDENVWALPVQFHFIAERGLALMEWASSATRPLVMERGLDEDMLFFSYYRRRGAIDESMERAYTAFAGKLRELTPRPSLVVHLRADPGAIVERLSRPDADERRQNHLRGDALRKYIEDIHELYDAWAAQVAAGTQRYVEYRTDQPAYDVEEVLAAILAVGR